MINFDALYDRLCDWCGKEYDCRTRKGSTYCSDECASMTAKISDDANSHQKWTKSKKSRKDWKSQPHCRGKNR
jgi:hypothetical protein